MESPNIVGGQRRALPLPACPAPTGWTSPLWSSQTAQRRSKAHNAGRSALCGSHPGPRTCGPLSIRDEGSTSVSSPGCQFAGATTRYLAESRLRLSHGQTAPGDASPSQGIERRRRSGNASAPGRSDVSQQSGIDDDSPERIDETHVPSSKATYGPNVDAPVETIVGGALQQGEDRERVDGRVLDLRDRLPRRHEEYSERSLEGSRCYQRSLPIGGREAVKKALFGGARRLAIPAEGSAEAGPEAEEKPDGRVHGCELARRQELANVDDGAAGASSAKVYRPDIVQGNIRQQRMSSEVNALELLRRNPAKAGFH